MSVGTLSYLISGELLNEEVLVRNIEAEEGLFFTIPLYLYYKKVLVKSC